MLRRSTIIRMCVQGGPPTLCSILIAGALVARPATAQLIDGLTSWADATAGLSTAKWRGQRVPHPTPTPRPVASSRVDSLRSPISVHGAAGVDGARLLRVLEAAEASQQLLSAAGLLASFGDAGQAGTGGRDIYVVEAGERGANAAIDPSGNFSALDGARAYALVDARLPAERVLVCTSQALIEAELYELDPAEAENVRRSSAAYFAYLLTGERGCDDDPPAPSQQSPFASGETARGAAWFERLCARQDRNRGTFLYEMWQFARQRTWEGEGLRGSPDLFEAIAKALELQREPFSLVAAELADAEALAGQSYTREIVWQALPSFSGPGEPALEPLGSTEVLVRLDRPHVGERLRAWSKGELGGRFTLAATRLAHDGKPLARLEREPRKDPNAQLSVELDAATGAVLVSVTNLGAGIPDFDLPIEPRRVSITIDRAP